MVVLREKEDEVGIQDNVPLGRHERAMVSLVINFIALSVWAGGFFISGEHYGLYVFTQPIALVLGLIGFAAGFTLRDVAERSALEQVALIISYVVIGLLFLPVLYLSILAILYMLGFVS